MKRYTDLTHKELIALSENEIERLIDLEIAHEGIMPILCPKKPSLEDEGISRTEIVYKINGLLFANEEDALKVCQMKTFTENYEYKIGYSYKYLEPIIDASVAKMSFYKKEDVARIADVLQRNKIKREDYQSQKNEYDKYLETTGSIRSEVYRVYYEAINFEKELNLAREILEKYKNLANGNKEIAMGFFKNAYKNREDILEKIFQKEVVSNEE